MTFLADLINPIEPDQVKDKDQLYQYLNNVYDGLTALMSINNPSFLTNSNFNTLSGAGTTPTTPADGDNFEFIGDWFVLGAANADYVITPTAYPANSSVPSSSLYYVNLTTSTFTDAFLFYQDIPLSVRQFQQQNVTYGIFINNNQNVPVKIRMDVQNVYDPSNVLSTGKPIYLQPGMNQFSSTIQIPSLAGVSVGGSNYTRFIINFLAVNPNGTCDLDIYLLKCEYGTLTTQLQ